MILESPMLAAPTKQNNGMNFSRALEGLSIHIQGSIVRIRFPDNYHTSCQPVASTLRLELRHPSPALRMGDGGKVGALESRA